MVFIHVISRNNHCVKKSTKHFQKDLNFRNKIRKKNTYASKIVSDISNCIWFIVKYARLWADNKWQKDDCIVFFFHEIKRYVKFTRECFVAE